ncbi:unnamed protein product [Cuscuta campestris]|uniref:Nucleotide-diphospho-sugar transferase domain-containing protein n=2 Tax=Cuscuta sect. Cleistogrammica TaxID=1824901 RepID=A0A484L116_9ASTE|nr:hypothetical protein DM860_004462 [Cuscuta australis]VFQ69980.1 unnamed protein product [Cuscuta campestris]
MTTGVKMDRSHNKKYPITSLAMLSLLLVISLCLCTWTPLSISFLPQPHLTSKGTVVKDYLEEALQRATMGARSKTVIITIINRAYVEPVSGETQSMLDLFLEGFWEGEGTRALVNRMLVVSVDRTAYQRCVFRRLHCYRLRTTDGGGDGDYASEKLYLSDGFVRMMWRRTLFLTDVLKRGYNFIFTDTDIIWLRNPFTRLSLNTTEDLQISTDAFDGDPWSEKNPINTGFYYVRSNNRTIMMFEAWYKLRERYPSSSRMKEQDVLAKMKRDGMLRDMGLLVRCLDVVHFSGFCSDSKDVSAVVTVHANCCKSIKAKMVDLRNVLKDWKIYRHQKYSSSGGDKEEISRDFKWSEHVSCRDSWKGFNETTIVHCLHER